MGTIDQWISTVQDKSSNFLDRSSAIRELAKEGSAKAVATLKQASADSDSLLQRDAVKALGKINSVESTAALIEILEGDNHSLAEQAAQLLGDAGVAEARSALQRAADSDSLSLKFTAQRVLRKLDSAIASMPEEPTSPSASFELKDLAPLLRQSLLDANVDITEHEPGKFSVVILLADGRKQKVYVRGDSTDASGSPLICVYTVCAPATKANYEYALRYNMRMSFGALAVNDHGENSYLVIVDTLLAQTAQPIALRKSIDSVAKHGDKMEQSLTGQDVQ
jgi:hypothetical protein